MRKKSPKCSPDYSCVTPCRVSPSDVPQTPRTGGDPDTAACCPLPGCALPGTPLIWSMPRTQPGFSHTVCEA
jgi:hypothetical protein